MAVVLAGGLALCPSGATAGATTSEARPPAASVDFPVVRAVDGLLHIHGTPASEEIVIEIDGDTGVAAVRYDADLDDPANTIESAVFAGPFEGLAGDLRGGSDRLEVRGFALAGAVDLDLGAGDDEVLLVGLDVDGDLRLIAGSGDDQLWLFDVTLGGPLLFSLGFGDDTVTLAGGAIEGRTTMLGSRGDDRVTLAEVHLVGPISVNAGRGDDEFRVFLSHADRVRFIGYQGNDSVDLADTTIVGSAWFVGNGGDDAYTTSGTTTFALPPTVIGFP